jgi:hypothetical protein
MEDFVMHPTSQLVRRAACALAVWSAVSVAVPALAAPASRPLLPLRSVLEGDVPHAAGLAAVADTSATAATDVGGATLRSVPAARVKTTTRLMPFFVLGGAAAVLFLVVPNLVPAGARPAWAPEP